MGNDLWLRVRLVLDCARGELMGAATTRCSDEMSTTRSFIHHFNGGMRTRPRDERPTATSPRSKATSPSDDATLGRFLPLVLAFLGLRVPFACRLLLAGFFAGTLAFGLVLGFLVVRVDLLRVTAGPAAADAGAFLRRPSP